MEREGNNQRRPNQNGQQRNNNRSPQNNNRQQQPQQKPKKVKNPDPMGNPVAMGRHGIKTIRDIAFSKCNTESCFEYFRNSVYVQSVMNEVTEKLKNEYVYQTALNAMYMSTGDPRVQHLLKKHNNAVYAWDLVYRVLFQISQTGDPSPLLVLANQLPQFKHSL